MKATILVLLAFLVVSCAPPAPDVTVLRKQIDEMMQKAEKDMVSGMMDTTLSQYADDPISMPNNGPMLKGKGAIREYYGKMMSMGMKFTMVKFNTQEVFAGGKYAYEVGTYAMTMQMANMPEMKEDGKYLNVYEIGTDGKLKIKAETWNSNTMPPMPEKGN